MSAAEQLATSLPAVESVLNASVVSMATFIMRVAVSVLIAFTPAPAPERAFPAPPLDGADMADISRLEKIASICSPILIRTNLISEYTCRPT
jgi:hypothetical protein